MYKFIINKGLFENILLKKVVLLEKEANRYWKKELLVPKIIDDSIFYEIKKIDKILLANTLGEDKPQIIIECKKIEYIKNEMKFKIYLGNILEQKNINNFKDEKDILINQLIDEKKELMEILQKIKSSIK